MNIEGFVAVLSFTLTLTVTLVGAMLWVRQKQQTRIAQQLLKASEQARHEVNAERDFAHMMRNYQQLNEGMNLLVEEVREAKQQLSELKTLVLSRKEEK